MPYTHSKDPQLTQTGRLQVDALAFSSAVPAEGAVVRVMPHGKKYEVIEEMITDSSGQTPVLSLPAPPIEYSMEPSEKIPYSEYDVSITAEGYEPVVVEGVQILPETTSYQDVNLHTILDYDNQNTIVIEDHVLLGTHPPKIPEEDVKPLPPSMGLVVLPEPVVPEFVIVHMGRPQNTSAKRHWIPFKDYIKNVASSEIYANWPAQTIKANVLAIISFTLNRVFTEWYRGKGHDFTITSSTAFDQAFNYGRNIFDEISVIVDEIFTTFITKPNIRQPLLTQYCDGRKVSCPNWMTQWGAKSLGDQGYAAIDILKHFYGNEIYLMQAPKVEGVPASYPGTPLQMGSAGENVRIIQEQINAISNNFPAIKKVRVDGIFGDQTRESIETFQRVFKLAPDGIVGFSTWYKLSDIYVAVTRMAELR